MACGLWPGRQDGGHHLRSARSPLQTLVLCTPPSCSSELRDEPTVNPAWRKRRPPRPPVPQPHQGGVSHQLHCLPPKVPFAPCLALLGAGVQAAPSSPGLLGRGPGCWGGVSPSSCPYGVRLGSWDNGLFLQPRWAWLGEPQGGRGAGGGAESPGLARSLPVSPLPPPLQPWGSTRPSQPPLDS